jgi:hypothetical protein
VDFGVTGDFHPCNRRPVHVGPSFASVDWCESGLYGVDG